MSDKYNFKTVSLRNSTYSKLDDLTEQLVPGIKLSGAKAVEKLIIDRHSDFNDEKEISYDQKTIIEV